MHFYLKWFRNIYVICGIVILAIIIGLLFWRQQSTQVSTKTVPTSTCPATPTFAAVLPSGKTIESLGDWKPLCPPDSTPTYVYSDQISGISISVSEQPLPANLRDNPTDQVASLAEKSNYSNAISAGDTTAYVGTSAKGPQSAMLTKNNLLVLIKSKSKITDAAWTKYIKSLN